MISQGTFIKPNLNLARREQWRKAYGAFVIMVILLVWWYPYLGLAVPVVMVMGLIGGFLRGRYVCGNLCPRGSFLDTWVSSVSGNRKLPSSFRSMWFRVLVLAGLMSFLAWQLSQNVGSLVLWGYVFWMMCLLTTLVAMALATIFAERTWCMICPMGTNQELENHNKFDLKITSECRNCKTCEQCCPIDLSITDYRDKGVISERDCLKCARCVSHCHHGALQWPQTN